MAEVPANQKVEKVLETCFNNDFAAKAESLFPSLHEWQESPKEVISFVPDKSNYFKCRPKHRHTISELNSLEWGKGSDFILDFGTHRVGYLAFYLGAAGLNIDAPCRLRLVFGEVPYDVMDSDKPVDTWISTSWIPDEIINVDDLPTAASLPRRYSFRYVRIQVIDTSPKYKVIFNNIQVRAVSSANPSIILPPLPTGDAQLGEIDRVAIHTLRDCMQTVFEDGPRRDRRLWLGDLRLQALTNYCTFGNLALVKRCLYLFASLPRSDSSLPATLFERPTLRAATDYIVDYDALFGPTVYDYVRASNDLSTGIELWPTILGSMKVALSHLDPCTYRFNSAATSTWKFIDWAEDLDTDASMHGLVLFACRRINALATLLCQTPPFENEVTRMVEAASSFVSTAATPCIVSGCSEQVSWVSAAWLCLGEAFPKSKAKANLLATIAHPGAIKPLTPYAFHHVAEALARVGAEKECLQLVREYWGAMLAAGADTYWECFDAEDSTKSPYGDVRNNSFCHAWSCTPSYLLRVVLKEFLEKERERL